ncbi:lethal(2) giant larvae protein homolog 1 isoform X1 [Rhineura floridana]|uniref:lethal(2) giant larvae protein homolog 1 isoform X1 n=2 Tax=Rhineura floridana TaxID=261503 RepID=UPI002AC880A1|nr:lethal(2) giant larvae protein homolog 1 isoform X1 [Rhineura floridana]
MRRAPPPPLPPPPLPPPPLHGGSAPRATPLPARPPAPAAPGKMMKFRFRRQGHDPQREKIKQDLFAFNKTVEHGFPNQPSSLAFDPKLRIMAIGTKSGAVKIYGAPGVEFTGLHRETATVTQMHFLPGQGRLLSLLDDNTLHLWEIYQRDGYSHLEETHSFVVPGRPGFDTANSPPSITRVTVILLRSTCDVAYLGTEGGGVYFLELPSLTLQEDRTLYQDEVLQRVPEEYRCGKALGPVESLQEHPRDPARVLIGYSRGLMVLWNKSTRDVEHLFLGNQQLESLGWERSGRTIVSSHSDGGYAVWPVTGSSPKTLQPATSTIPYGPFPCKAINKIVWLTCESGDHYIIFSGGMPRASYGDRHCVTILQGQTLVTLDFTSRVIDFFTVYNTEVEEEFDNPTALVVLVEEELVVIDLQTPGWPTIPAPYLAPLHSSAITCSYHISNVPLKLWERIISAGEHQSPRLSFVNWPINGGRNLAQEPTQRGILLTGHEDGTVRFWDASGVSLKPLYKLGTANIFQTDCEHNDSLNQTCEEDWPPFRKVGCFDPYSDDPRLGIQKIALCKYTAKMVVAGTAGQVLVMELGDEKSEHMINVAVVDLLQDREGFTWKGHDRLSPKNGSLSFAPGFQPSALVQCMPPAAVTAVTLHSEWNLVAFGTSHGFGLYDYYRRNSVLARCTLHPNDSLAMEGPLSRVKSLKKSLRQSFRRIRKSRVSGKKRVNTSSPSSKVQEANAQLAEQPGPHEVEMTPVQRRIEPRSADDSLSGVVRCLYFADTFLRDAAHHGPTMWAGTNSGSVFAYALEVPSQEKFSERSVEAVLGKEIQLMHRAPVVSIAVLDGRGNPLPEPYEVSRDLAKAPDVQGSHSVLIASEEQFKVFTLPKVSAKTKFKLTAHEGCRVRKVGLVNFVSVACEDYTENCLACLTNLGDIHVFTVPGLRPQVHYDCIRKEDISGIASCIFTKHGQGFYLISPSEFERFSLSTRNITEPLCVLDTSRVHDSTCLGNNFTAMPKLNQANGMHALQGSSEANHSLASSDRSPDEHQASFSVTPVDSPNNSIDTPLDTTGDITAEEVKDYLAPLEEAERNLRNISEDEARSPGILIK